ncbi:hypothetical protein IGI39_003995 [Enterococcus sp. AZ135]|uniref:minor capsid protein n=1 Tax=unclassified Enterococcus TaxID=2608891 RepID=UPI003F2601D1
MAGYVKVDVEGIRAKLSPQAMIEGRRALANQMLADMHPFVPKKDNHLRQAVSIARDGSEIIYSMPYAKAQFYGTNGKTVFRNYSTPGTGKRWDLQAKGLYMASWERAFLRGAGF